jgi:hypothetical protein
MHKLSTAIRKGYKIAQKNGIKQVKGRMFKRNKAGNLTGACVLGMAKIGKYGLDACGDYKHYGCVFSAYVSLKNTKHLTPQLVSECLGDAITLAIVLNDKYKKNALEIADVIEKCGK